MSDVKIQARDNGPLLVQGAIQLQDGEGNTYETKEATYLCRCGLSMNKPFCDGAHKGKFESQTRVPS
jgi:CDGSH-type Zn-finger protein